jgi:broad specificity phosphatase PhoE
VTRVLVIRHGQSEANVPQIWTSAVEGYPLTPLGWEQAAALGVALKDRDVSALYASPLVRAQETAAALGEALGLETITLPGVEELHVGVHEGGSNEDVGPIAIGVFERWWLHDDLDHGFEGGETGRHIVERMARALDGLADAHPGQTVAMVSHGGAIAVGLTALCPELTPEFVSQNFLANTEVVEVVRAPDGTWRCESWATTTF